MTDPSFQLRVPSSGPVVTGTPGYVLTFGADGRSVSGMPGGGGGAVASVFGRAGVVVAQAGDYAASQVTNDSSVPGFSVKDALNALLAGGGGVVLSVFGRIGAVVAANGDYTTSQVTNASTVSGTTATDALNTVQTHLTSLDGSVVSLGGLIAGLQASNIHNNSSGPGTTVADTLTTYNVHLSSLDGSVVSLGSLIAGLQASNIGNNSTVTGTSVKDALNTLLTTTGALVASVGVAGALTLGGTSTAPIVTTVGGLRTGLLDNTARDAIPGAQRDVGTTAYVVSTDRTWRLIGGTSNANWVDVTIGPVSATAAGLVPSVGALNTVLQSTGAAGIWNSNLTLGATPATAGQIRLSAGAGIDSLAIDGVTNLSAYKATTSVNNIQTFGDALSSITQIQGSAVGGIWFSCGPGTPQTMTLSSTLVNFQLAQVQFAALQAVTALGVVVNIANLNSGSTAQDLYLRAQGNTNATSSGGSARLQGGRPGAGGKKGGGAIQLNVDDTTANMQTFVEVREVAVGQRMVALCFGADATTAFFGANTGDKVIGIADAATAPTGAPGAGGHLHYSVGGNPAMWTPNGAKTTVGAAGGASALPATPLGYIPMTWQGVAVCVPFYNP